MIVGMDLLPRLSTTRGRPRELGVVTMKESTLKLCRTSTTLCPRQTLLLYPEDVEPDDWLHNPDPNDPDKIRCDIFNKRGLVNVGGLAFITLGILVLFVGYPIMYVFRSLLVIMTHLGINGSQIICTEINTSHDIHLCY